MIYGNLRELEKYSYLEENVYKCLELAKNNNLHSVDNGVYYIDDKKVYYNIIEFDVVDREEKVIEAHKRYIDIHLILRGKEKIEVGFTPELEVESYSEDTDFMVVNGELTGEVVLRENDFLVCYPEDAHMPGIIVDKKENVKKAVFKIMV